MLMMLRTPWKRLIGLVLFAGLGLSQQAFGDAAELVNLLTTNLGVTEEQAAGGSGAIFGYAKQQMSPADFSQLSSTIPGLDSLLARAPALESQGGATGRVFDKAGSLLGGDSSGLSQLGGSFAKLGMSPDMVSKFAPMILDYVNSAGGSELMGSLKSALM
jgi:hypothetical protein